MWFMFKLLASFYLFIADLFYFNFSRKGAKPQRCGLYLNSRLFFNLFSRGAMMWFVFKLLASFYLFITDLFYFIFSHYEIITIS